MATPSAAARAGPEPGLALVLAFFLALRAGAGFAEPGAEGLEAAEKALDQALSTQAEAVDEAVASQARVDELRAGTAALLAEFRNLSKELESLERYHAQVERMIDAQQRAIAEAEARLAAAAVTERELIPLMARMVESLQRFVRLDLPFQRAERQARARHLAAVIDDPELRLAEKYRRILAAYREEMDYGRSLAAYREPLPAALPGLDEQPVAVGPGGRGTEPIVDLLRIGRVALFYRSLDGRRLGVWDPEQREWVALPPRWGSALTKALRVARRQAAPDLLTLPLPSPELRP